MLSNGIVAFASGLYAQYQGFADINMGRGAIVIGLAAIIIGEAILKVIFKKGCSFYTRLSSVIVGGIIYYIIMVVILWLNIDSCNLNHNEDNQLEKKYSSYFSVNDGYIFITGKKKNLIILSNGKNVSPEELERKFDQFPYIREVCVYEQDGEIVGEFYLDTEQYPDAEALLKKDILSVNRRLPKYKNIVKTKIRNVPFERNHMMKALRRGH